MPESHELAQQVAYALQLAVGAVFLLSVVPKLRRPGAFAATVVRYELMPPALARPLAAAVVAIEAFLAVCFITGALLEPALAAAAVTLLAFGGALAINLRRGRDIECGCFGGAAERISPRGLARVALLLLVTLVLAGLVSARGVEPTTIGALADAGTPALAYLVNAAGTAAFVLIAGLWLLSAAELRSLLGRRAA